LLLELGRGVPPLDTDELDAGWEAVRAEQRFWEAHYAEYLQHYPEQFVAVKDGEVIATQADLLELLQALKSKGLAPTQVWMHFITANPYSFLH
jgi:hypothetical protein